MKAAVIVFPGSNCDRDLAEGFREVGADVSMVWHKDVSLPDGLDVIGIPGGFSFGDYLRCGAIAAQSPICRAVEFVCRNQTLRVETTQSPFTSQFVEGSEITIPIAHHDGNYSADPELLRQLQAEDRVAFTYVDNPNGSAGDIAAILSQNRRVLGLMPHPERAVDPVQGNSEGRLVFSSVIEALALA